MNLRYNAYFICPKIAQKPYLSLKLLASHLLNYFRASENDGLMLFIYFELLELKLPICTSVTS